MVVFNANAARRLEVPFSFLASLTCQMAVGALPGIAIDFTSSWLQEGEGGGGGGLRLYHSTITAAYFLKSSSGLGDLDPGAVLSNRLDLLVIGQTFLLRSK